MSDGDAGRMPGGRWGSGSRRRSPLLATDGGSDVDRLLDALCERRCRIVLRCLDENDGADLEEIAEYVVEHDGDDAREETVTRVRSELHHRHLPKLADHGLISYDSRTNTASLEPMPNAAERIVDLTRELEESNDR